ncbi:hypothetical protein BPOR_0093g00230 [Botrytis porri]|uniref:Uncharacterized protein n=1 Tax=Botrytis porri TaxID=87229 RepID=A0A4Z1KZ26_9HELO|nr:hypothetical protein BPOR_0093g00230 [Botrytis porri]
MMPTKLQSSWQFELQINLGNHATAYSPAFKASPFNPPTHIKFTIHPAADTSNQALYLPTLANSTPHPRQSPQGKANLDCFSGTLQRECEFGFQSQEMWDTLTEKIPSCKHTGINYSGENFC